MINVYTDISWSPIRKIATYAYIIKEGHLDIRDVGVLGITQNPATAEVLGLKTAVIKLLDLDNYKHVTIYTDNWHLVHKFNARKFRDDIGKQLKLIMLLLGKVYQKPFILSYVEAHNTSQYNNWCDYQARKLLRKKL